MAPGESALDVARRNVLAARQVVGRQKKIIATKKAAGSDTTVSEALLTTFQRTLTTFEDHLAAVIAGIKL